MSLLLLFGGGNAGRLGVAAAALALSAPDPAIVASGNVTLQADACVLSLSAPAPALPSVVYPGAAVLSLSPPNPAFAESGVTLAATAAALQLSDGLAALTVDLTKVAVSIAGITRTSSVRLSSLTITDELDEAPNTCAFVIDGFTPNDGDEVIITLGGTNKEFAGHIKRAEQVYEGKNANIAYHCSCVDYMRLFNRRKVYKRYTNQSATAIIQDLVPSFSSGFTANHVGSSLATIALIEFDGEDLSQAITRVMKLIGGAWYVDYDRDVHAFITETVDAPDDITDAQHRIQNAPSLTKARDLEQVRTRVMVRGAGTQAASDVAAGSTSVPVDDATIFESSGTPFIKAGPQRGVSYTGKAGTGTSETKVAGPNRSPSAISGFSTVVQDGSIAPAQTQSSRLRTGYAYKYGVSQVTKTGESEIVSSSNYTVGGARIDPPNITGSPITPTTASNGQLIAGTTYFYGLTYITDAGETPIGWIGSASPTGAQNAASIDISILSTYINSEVRVKRIGLYRSKIIQANPAKVGDIDRSVIATPYVDVAADLALGNPPPVDNTADWMGAVAMTVAIGASDVTARKMWRTVAGAAGTFKHIATINDNTTTPFIDIKGDSALTTDAERTTSTLDTPKGATSLGCESTTGFASSGWINANGQILRYASLSATAFQGIPGSGIGSITAVIPHGSPVNEQPHLIGVSGLVYALTKGDGVNHWVERNDAAAQATLAAREGGDGIHEHEIKDDALTSVAACQARGDAELALFSTSEVSLSFTSRDTKLRSGKSVTVSLGAPTSISGVFKIQRVTSSQYGVPKVYPLRQVQASSYLFTLDHLLRRVSLGG